jgi:hypothetical protein
VHICQESENQIPGKKLYYEIYVILILNDIDRNLAFINTPGCFVKKTLKFIIKQPLLGVIRNVLSGYSSYLQNYMSVFSASNRSNHCKKDFD